MKNMLVLKAESIQRHLTRVFGNGIQIMEAATINVIAPDGGATLCVLSSIGHDEIILRENEDGLTWTTLYPPPTKLVQLKQPEARKAGTHKFDIEMRFTVNSADFNHPLPWNPGDAIEVVKQMVKGELDFPQINRMRIEAALSES